tara:strand:+ start:293 stop:427 length:135 start_codon:yes stop_codon:yes gene_type:complete
MKNLFLYIAVFGLFYTALNGSLYDMTVADCDAGIVRACEVLDEL